MSGFRHRHVVNPPSFFLKPYLLCFTHISFVDGSLLHDEDRLCDYDICFAIEPDWIMSDAIVERKASLQHQPISLKMPSPRGRRVSKPSRQESVSS